MDLWVMKFLSICIFFVGMLVIVGLAFQLLRGIDNDFPLWLKLVLGSMLALAIVGLVLFIRGYVGGGTRSKEK
jgi:hypothetical protein